MHANLYYCLNVSMHNIKKLPRHNVDAMRKENKFCRFFEFIDSYRYYKSYIHRTCTKCHIEVDLLPYNWRYKPPTLPQHWKIEYPCIIDLDQWYKGKKFLQACCYFQRMLMVQAITTPSLKFSILQVSQHTKQKKIVWISAQYYT